MVKRRLKIWYLPRNIAINLLNLRWELSQTDGRNIALHLPKISNVPEDAYVHSVYFDHMTLSFAVVIYHKSFPIVPDGQMLPVEPSKLNYETIMAEIKLNG